MYHTKHRDTKPVVCQQMYRILCYYVRVSTAPTDVTCWEKLNDLLYLVARKCGWLDIIQGKLVGPHTS